MTHGRQLALAVAIALAAAVGQVRAQAKSMRLYVFDCGTLHYDNADAYALKRNEVARTDMSMACFLIVHPRGALLWDVGAVADGTWRPTGAPVRMRVMLPGGAGERDVTMRRTLESQ